MSQLQIIISSGPEAEEKAVLGFTFALGALAFDAKVVLFLTMQGAAWINAANGVTSKVKGFEPVDFYWNQLIAMGAKIEGCSGCVENYLNALPGGKDSITQRSGYTLSGLSTASMRATSMPTVNF